MPRKLRVKFKFVFVKLTHKKMLNILVARKKFFKISKIVLEVNNQFI